MLFVCFSFSLSSSPHSSLLHSSKQSINFNFRTTILKTFLNMPSNNSGSNSNSGSGSGSGSSYSYNSSGTNSQVCHPDQAALSRGECLRPSRILTSILWAGQPLTAAVTTARLLPTRTLTTTPTRKYAVSLAVRPNESVSLPSSTAPTPFFAFADHDSRLKRWLVLLQQLQRLYLLQQWPGRLDLHSAFWKVDVQGHKWPLYR